VQGPHAIRGYDFRKGDRPETRAWISKEREKGDHHVESSGFDQEVSSLLPAQGEGDVSMA